MNTKLNLSWNRITNKQKEVQLRRNEPRHLHDTLPAMNVNKFTNNYKITHFHFISGVIPVVEVNKMSAVRQR